MNEELARLEYTPGVFLVSVLGDLTTENVDAIVNAANSRLRHGGGVAGSIVERGGAAIQQESLKLAPVPTGSAAVTGAGELPCKWVIHAVGPVWGGGASGEEELLSSAVSSALAIAEDKGTRSLSFATISAGIFGMPAQLAADTLVNTVANYLAETPDTVLEEVRFCNIDRAMAELISTALDKLPEQKTA